MKAQFAEGALILVPETHEDAVVLGQLDVDKRYRLLAMYNNSYTPAVVSFRGEPCKSSGTGERSD